MIVSYPVDVRHRSGTSDTACQCDQVSQVDRVRAGTDVHTEWSQYQVQLQGGVAGHAELSVGGLTCDHLVQSCKCREKTYFEAKLS